MIERVITCFNPSLLRQQGKEANSPGRRHSFYVNVLTLASNDFLHFCFECLQWDYLKQEAEVAVLQFCSSLQDPEQ